MSRILVETLGAKVEEVSASATLCDKGEKCNKRCFSYLLHPQQSAAPQLLARWLSQWHPGKEQIKLWKRVSVLLRCYRSILVLLNLVVERVFADWMDQSTKVGSCMIFSDQYITIMKKLCRASIGLEEALAGMMWFLPFRSPRGPFFVAAAPGHYQTGR